MSVLWGQISRRGSLPSPPGPNPPGAGADPESGPLRGDGDLGVRVLLHFFQVASFLPDEATHEVVVGQNLERNLVGSEDTSRERERTSAPVLPPFVTPENRRSGSGTLKVPGRFRMGKNKTYVLVSLASWCMMSRIMRQAAEQPSGVEWMLMGFSAAPAFSLR